jgi:lipopolysaccharide export system permease protein
MIASFTLGRYLARQYLLWFVVFLAGLSGIIFLFELAELFRRAADASGATFGVIFRMGIYKLPNTIDKVLPFVVLFSGMFTFWRMTRSQELIIARSSGVSAWQFLAPAFCVTFLFSLLNITILNAAGAAMNVEYKKLEARYLSRSASLELTGAGLWLRQTEKGPDGEKRYLLHADHVDMDPLTLTPLIAFIFDGNDKYLGRIDAPSATLENAYWKIDNAWFNFQDEPSKFVDHYKLHTSLTLEKIQESMAPPTSVSIWELPKFIQALHMIGLPSTRHEIQFHVLLAQPFLLCAMVFFAATFSLRLNRRGGIVRAVLAGLFTGSAIFSLNNVVIALGANQTLPVVLAAWAIPLATFIAGNAALLYLEDG